MALKNKALVKLDADIIQGLVNSCLVERFDNATESPDCHREWWELCTSSDINVAIAAPRRHAKSTAITLAYTLATILFRERDFVMIVSATEGQSILFLGDLKKELTENDNIQNLFGKITLIKDSETDIIGCFEDGTTFKVIAKSAGQKLRGIKWDSKRPNLIVIDDLEEDEAVLNQERRDKMARWFYGALIPSRSANGIIRYVGTILHMDSLLENLMPKEHEKRTVVEDLKIYSTDTRKAWKAVKYKAHTPNHDKILWPSQYDKDYFIRLYEDFKARGLTDVYSQEYLNHPIDEGNSFFRRSDFLPIGEKKVMHIEENPHLYSFYVAGDLAITEKERSDYSVFVVVAVDNAGILYMVDVLRDRMDSIGIIEAIFSMQERYRPEMFTLEAGAIEKSLGPILRKEMNARNIYINLNPMNPTKDKQSRARSLQARMRAGGVRFFKEADWYPVYEQEMLQFPRSRHDDQVDASAWVGLTIDKIIEGQTQEEFELDEYEEEVLASSQFSDSGRSIYTGY